MRLDQVRDEQDRLTIAFTDDALTVPGPFAQVIRDHLAALPNRNTAAHPDSPWLFPGSRPGKHLHQNMLMIKLRDAGIDLRGARNAAMRALVLELPAPVVADSLNYSYNVTDKQALRTFGGVRVPGR